MGLLDTYNNLTTEQQQALGKSSSKINKPGTHLVTIEKFCVIDDSRVKVDFKDASGLTIDYTGFLTNKDPSKVEATVQRVMSQLTSMCNAAGLELKKVLSKSTIGTETTKAGKDMSVESYPTAVGKKLYITTYTEIEQDDKDANKAWARQVVDVFNFFDTKKRNGLEIQTDVDEGTTMEDTDASAKTRFEINYKCTNSPACITKLAQLTEANYVASGTTNAPTSQPESDDDI